MNNRYQILNTYVNAISMDETIKEVEKIIENKKPTQHVVINASKVNLMEKDDNLRKIVNSCPLINADGASIVWAAKKIGIPLKERVTGCDLFQELVGVAAKKGYREKELKKIVLNVKEKKHLSEVKKTWNDSHSTMQ